MPDVDRLYDWFSEAAQLSSEEQASFLESRRASEPTMVDQLQRLLSPPQAIANKLERFFNTQDSDCDVPHTLKEGGKREAGFEVAAPAVIGPYKLLEPIGEGGMGVVYLAQQSQPVRRKVALKIIKPGMDSRQVVARFEAERQALAMMDHSNIAKVLDAGTTDKGRPYFVMELVRGIPISEYCDRAKMPIRQRLELFCDACDAIQHAHNKGIIHRDIKPSNVLVTENDGTPLVKVIDFGVAKALTGNLTDKTMYTGVFQMIGTPLYMSPEQASLSNFDVDTRSDVYSLGVLLYELITGMLPIDRESIKEMNYEQLRHHIESSEPVRPSRRLSTLKDELETIAERRGLDIHQIRRHAGNELDWIVMKAIEKVRTRRYQSARELGEDVRRYLRDEAVEACPPSFVYRAQKYARRHKRLLGTAALIGSMLLLSTLVSTGFAVQANQERGKAVAAQQQSEQDFAAALGAIDKLLEHASSPDLAEVPQVQPIRKRILEDVLAFYNDFRATTGDSLQTQYRAGRTWLSLGALAADLEELQRAEESFQQAISVAESLTSAMPDNRDYQALHLKSLEQLGTHYLHRRNAPQKAQELYQEKLEIIDGRLHNDPQSRAFWLQQKVFAYRELASAARLAADYESAVEYISKTESIINELGVPNRNAEFEHQKSLAVAYRMTDPVKADLYMRRALELGRELFDEDTNRQTLHSYGSYLLGWANFYHRRDPQFAYALADDIVRIYGKLTTEFPDTLVYLRHLDSAIGLQTNLVRSGEVAGVTLSKLIDQYFELYPRSSQVHLANANQLVALSEHPAVPLREAIEFFPTRVEYRLALANLLVQQGLMEEAFLEFGIILDRIDEISSLADELADSVRTLHESDRLEDALDLAEFFRKCEADHYKLLIVLGEAHLELGQYQEGLHHIDRAIRQAPRQWWLYKRRARANFELGRLEEAISDVTTAYEGGQAASDIYALLPWSILRCEDEAYRQSGFDLVDRAYREHPQELEFLKLQLEMLVLNRAIAAKQSDKVAFTPAAFDQDEALRDLRRTWGLGEEHFDIFYKMAVLDLSVHNGNGFPELCRQMTEKFRSSDNPLICYFTTWTAALAPGALKDYGPAIELARRAAEREPDNHQYASALGAILFRSGDFESARSQLHKALKLPADEKTSSCYVRYFLVMAESALGDRDAASQMLGAANREAESELSNSQPWNRKLTLELLRNEAENLLAN